jgi:tol-pal system protein YbgF
MQKVRTFRNRFFGAGFLAVALVLLPVRAHAASKEIIELQTQVQQLLDMVQRLQSTVDSRFGVLQNLAQTTADNASQMSAAVNTLQQKIAAQNEAVSGKLDAASGQAQSLNDSVDELKSRIAKLDKSIQDLQTQLQNIQNPPTAAPATTGSPAANSEVPAGAPSVAIPSGSQTPPLKETFQAGVRDYNAAKYDVAAGEFQDVLHFYPMDDLAGTAHYYLGEIAYKRNKLSDAVKAYNAVLEGFSGNAKAPAAQLHKGMALLQMGRKDAGIHELRLLIQRHPQTPEATQARSKLNGLGAKPGAVARQSAAQDQ